jgi:hypothetical protein
MSMPKKCTKTWRVGRILGFICGQHILGVNALAADRLLDREPDALRYKFRIGSRPKESVSPAMRPRTSSSPNDHRCRSNPTFQNGNVAYSTAPAFERVDAT